MGNCCSSRKQEEQLPRPLPGRRRYSLGNTYNTYRTNPILELLEEEYQSNRNLEITKKGRPRREKYDLDGGLGPRRIEAWESRGKSRYGVRQRTVRGAGKSPAVRPSKSRKKTKTRRRKRVNFIEDDEDDSDSEDSEIETSDDDSDSDSDDYSGVDCRKMPTSVKRRRNQQTQRKRPGKSEKVIDENEGEEEDEDESLEEKDDNDDDEGKEQDEDRNNKRRNRKKSKSKQNAKGCSKKRAKAKTQPKLKVKKLVEDDKIALLEPEDDENDDEGNDSEDEGEQEDTSKKQESGRKGRAKEKEIEKPNPYRWTNPSPIFDKNKSSIYQRARAKGSDRESIRQLKIQRHRKRQERESSSKKPKISISKDTSDDDWTDTDASSLATSQRNGSTSSRLSSLFGPRNRNLTPEPTSYLMSPVSPLTRPSISSRTGQTTFGVTVIRASPLQEIVSADSLPANPEPNDTIITPPPAVHQRALSPLPKSGDPCMEGMKKVIFMSRGKRSSIKLVPSDGKPTDPDDVEIILTK